MDWTIRYKFNSKCDYCTYKVTEKCEYVVIGKEDIKLNLASPHSLVQFMLPEFVILVAFSISSCQD